MDRFARSEPQLMLLGLSENVQEKVGLLLGVELCWARVDVTDFQIGVVRHEGVYRGLPYALVCEKGEVEFVYPLHDFFSCDRR